MAAQMISVICVYNKESILEDALLNGLRKQTATFELITLDNRGGKFRSAAEAYNFGGAKAKGEYIMFVHQDMWLATRTWLEDVERIVGQLPDLGVAGVAGFFSMRDRMATGRKGMARCYYLHEPTPIELHVCGTVSYEVETLDECLLVIPRTVFNTLKFDESTFDGWDCYAADYCLTAKTLGLKAYVLPAPCSHCCARETYGRWEFKGLLKYQKRLYAKHRRDYDTICTWMGDINRENLRSWSREMLRDSLANRLAPGCYSFLRKELAGCESVLDLNCGFRSIMGRLGFRFSMGLDPFGPYLEESRRRGFHAGYVQADVRSLPFKPKSFDAVVALDVLEGLWKEQGMALLGGMEDLARKKVVVTTRKHTEPGMDFGYPVPERQSWWKASELAQLGFTIRGSGERIERNDEGSVVKLESAALRVLPTPLRQLVVYRYPRAANQLMAVKRIKPASAR